MHGHHAGTTRPGRRARSALGIALGALLLVACSSGTPSATNGSSTTAPKTTVSTNVASTGPIAPITGGVKGKPGYLVYWDQNEEEDFLSCPRGPRASSSPLGPERADVPAPRRPVRGGLRPHPARPRTTWAVPSPTSNPPTARSSTTPTAPSAGQTLYVPGPYKMPGQSIGSDSPPTANGVFNNNQTYTGCAIDKSGNVFGNDIATAQGDYPPPSSGRLVEWFAPTTRRTASSTARPPGGYGPHHTDGTGGLAQPGMMALADNGDVLVPNVGTSSVLRFAASSMPADASQCPGGVYPRTKVQRLGLREGRAVPGRGGQGPDV